MQNYRKNLNSILDLKDDDRNWVCYQNDLEKVLVDHFSKHFKDPNGSTITSQLKVLNKFPSFFTEQEGLHVGRVVYMKELEGVLKQFSKDKSPSLDGWIVELFLVFFI